MKAIISLLLIVSVSLASAAEGKRRFTNKEWYGFGVNDGFFQLAENECEPIYTRVQNETVRKARIIIAIMYDKDSGIDLETTDPNHRMVGEWMSGRGVADSFNRGKLLERANLEKICSAAYADAKQIVNNYRSDFDSKYDPAYMIHDPTYKGPKDRANK